MIIFVSMPSKGVFENIDGVWKTSDQVLRALADLHRVYPECIFIAPSIQNYAILPHLPEFGSTYETWKSRCRTLIDICELVVVLKTEHWKESVGVKDEIEYAHETGVQVSYYSC